MAKKTFNNESQVRIIGGYLRSRMIRFPSVPGLRPTPNRVRETVFNWLAPNIQGAKCLDLFAGSGALSFEALSRGASYCLSLDAQPEIVKALRSNMQKLDIQTMEIIQATFPYPRNLFNTTFDIIFVDPPFNQKIIPTVFNWLSEINCLSNEAIMYVESESQTNQLQHSDGWEIFKDKKTGNVRYSLLARL